MTDPALLELRAMRAAIDALTEEQAELRRCLLDKEDRRTGARLVPALAQLTQGRPFSPATAAALALNDNTPAGGVVRDAVADTADTDDGLRGFGRLLHRLRGVRFGALRLEPTAAGCWHVAGYSAK